jgi:surfactin family lipopeptide synthetase A/fengycin family lipopeptide synthetase B
VGPITISYKELNEKSNQLAHLLMQRGACPDTIVAIMMERCIDMMVGIMGIWKAGGAYLPIDPNYPEERINYMLADSNAGVLLSEGSKPTHLNPPTHPLTHSTTQLNLAYVIYTSGSTGKPKGALVEHIGMMNHMHAKITDLQLTGQSIIAQNATHTFDISVWQFFAALMVGGRTVIYLEDIVMQPDIFVSQLINHQVTVLEVVPSYLSVMLDYVGAWHALPLEYLLVTGEEIKPSLVKEWFEKYPGIKMVNAYGPTEASDDITHHIMDRAPDMERIPIGKPLQNFDIYVVDDHMQLCPVGVKGEICVSGIGVGRG